MMMLIAVTYSQWARWSHSMPRSVEASRCGHFTTLRPGNKYQFQWIQPYLFKSGLNSQVILIKSQRVLPPRWVPNASRCRCIWQELYPALLSKRQLAQTIGAEHSGPQDRVGEQGTAGAVLQDPLGAWSDSARFGELTTFWWPQMKMFTCYFLKIDT